MNPTYTLSREALQQIREAVATTTRMLGNVANRVDIIENDHQAPQVYAAFSPGVISGIGGLVPGHGDCSIYQIVNDDTTGVPSLEAVFGFTQTVHNLSAAAIPAQSWLPVWRDAYGKWLALSTGQAVAGSVQLGTGWFGSCVCWGGFNAAYDAAQVGMAPPLDYDGNPLVNVGQKTLVLRLFLWVYCPFDAGAVLSIGYAYLTNDWNAAVGYSAGTLVCSGGNLYYALVANVGVAPPSACTWLAAGTCPVDDLTAIVSGFDLTIADNILCEDGLCLKLSFDSRFPVQIVASTGLDGSLTRGCVQIGLETLSTDPCAGCDHQTTGLTAGWCQPGGFDGTNVNVQGATACYNGWLYIPPTIQVQIDSNVDFGGTIPAYTPLNHALLTLTQNPAGSDDGAYSPASGNVCVWDTGDTNVCTDTSGTQDGNATARLLYQVAETGAACSPVYMKLVLFKVLLVQMDLTTICQYTSTDFAVNPDPSAGNIALPNGGIHFPAHVIVDDTWGVATLCCSPVPFVLRLKYPAWTGMGPAPCPTEHVDLTWDPTQLVNPVYSDCPTNTVLAGYTAVGAWVGSGTIGGGTHSFRLYCANGRGDPLLLQGADGFPGPGWWLEKDGAVSLPCQSCTRGCNPFYVTFYSCAGDDCACPIEIAAPGYYAARRGTAPIRLTNTLGRPGTPPVARTQPTSAVHVAGRPAPVHPTRPGSRALNRLADCRHAGGPIQEQDKAKTVECGPCGGKTRLKVFACSSPIAGPETTSQQCSSCRYFEERE